MIIDNLEKTIMKHGISDAIVLSYNTPSDIQIQIPGVGASDFPRKGVAPSVIIATTYNSEGSIGFCTITDIAAGTFSVRVQQDQSGSSYFRVHWLAIWD